MTAPRPLDQPPPAGSGSAPSASTPTRPSAPARRRSAPPSSISATCRSTRSTSSSASHHHILWSRIPDYARGDLAAALSADKSVFEYWAHALAYIPTRDYRFFMADMKRHREHPRPGSAASRPPTFAASSPGSATTAPLTDPRHRRRRAGRQRPPLGQPQALEARAAARLLRRHAHGRRPRRHGEDLRAGRPSLRLAAAPARRHRGQTLDYLLDRALRAQGVVSLDSICYMDAPRKKPMAALIEARVSRRRLVPGRDRGPEAALGDPRGARRPTSRDRPRRTSSRRSTRWSSSAGVSPPSSATITASRPMSRRRNENSATSPCRSSSATASPRRSTSRPTAPRAGC